MPIVKISFNDDYYSQLTDMAREEGISIQDYIRNKLFGDTVSYTPADAVKRAKAKYSSGDFFTLPEIYGDDWEIKRGFAGVFGKQFYHYVLDECAGTIEFTGMINSGRHAQYRMV